MQQVNNCQISYSAQFKEEMKHPIWREPDLEFLFPEYRGYSLSHCLTFILTFQVYLTYMFEWSTCFSLEASWWLYHRQEKSACGTPWHNIGRSKTSYPSLRLTPRDHFFFWDVITALLITLVRSNNSLLDFQLSRTFLAMHYQSRRYCPVLVVQQGGGQCISP